MIKAPVFDGHNDLLLALWRSNDLDGNDFIFGRKKGHIDLPRCKKGGLKGGFFAIFVPATNVAPEAFWERHPDLVKNKKGAKEKALQQLTKYRTNFTNICLRSYNRDDKYGA